MLTNGLHLALVTASDSPLLAAGRSLFLLFSYHLAYPSPHSSLPLSSHSLQSHSLSPCVQLPLGENLVHGLNLLRAPFRVYAPGVGSMSPAGEQSPEGVQRLLGQGRGILTWSRGVRAGKLHGATVYLKLAVNAPNKSIAVSVRSDHAAFRDSVRHCVREGE